MVNNPNFDQNEKVLNFCNPDPKNHENIFSIVYNDWLLFF